MQTPEAPAFIAFSTMSSTLRLSPVFAPPATSIGIGAADVTCLKESESPVQVVLATSQPISKATRAAWATSGDGKGARQ